MRPAASHRPWRNLARPLHGLAWHRPIRGHHPYPRHRLAPHWHFIPGTPSTGLFLCVAHSPALLPDQSGVGLGVQGAGGRTSVAPTAASRCSRTSAPRPPWTRSSKQKQKQKQKEMDGGRRVSALFQTRMGPHDDDVRDRTAREKRQAVQTLVPRRRERRVDPQVGIARMVEEAEVHPPHTLAFNKRLLSAY